MPLTHRLAVVLCMGLPMLAGCANTKWRPGRDSVDGLLAPDTDAGDPRETAADAPKVDGAPKVDDSDAAKSASSRLGDHDSSGTVPAAVAKSPDAAAAATQPSPTDVISRQYRAVLAGLVDQNTNTDPPATPGLALNPLRSTLLTEPPPGPAQLWERTGLAIDSRGAVQVPVRAESPASHLETAGELAAEAALRARTEQAGYLDRRVPESISKASEITSEIARRPPTDVRDASDARQDDKLRPAERLYTARIETDPIAATDSETAAPERDPLEAEKFLGDWRAHLDRAVKSLETQVPPSGSGREDRVRTELQLRLLHLAAGNYDQAMRRIESLHNDEQEFLVNQLWSLRLYSDENQTPETDERLAETVSYVQKAMDHLRVQSALRLANPVLCTAVDGFGSFTEVKKYEFQPDQPVLLYVEVDNFTATELPKGGGYETELAGSYEILDSSGRRVADQRLPLDKPTCRNRRRDYYLAYQIYLPKGVDAGSYTLQLTVQDVKGGKFSQSSIPLQIK